MLECTKCKSIKPFSEFVKRKDSKKGYTSHCKKCRFIKQFGRDKLETRKGLKYKSIELDGNKLCTSCNSYKPLAYFENLYNKSGNLRAECKECKYIKNRCRKYNITVDELKKMINNQNNKCLICKNYYKDSKLVIDHCHATGKVRGLLCTKCNMALGLFKDDLDNLSNAYTYIKNSK